MKKYASPLTGFIFAVFAFGIVVPLFSSGRLFLLDMSWPPIIDLADNLRYGIEPGFALTLAIKLLSFVASTALLQKIVLTLVLVGTACCMYWLANAVYSSLMTMT